MRVLWRAKRRVTHYAVREGGLDAARGGRHRDRAGVRLLARRGGAGLAAEGHLRPADGGAGGRANGGGGCLD